MTIYKSGELVLIKPKGRTSIYYIAGLLGWLYFDLSEFKVAIEKQHNLSPIPKQLQSLITTYCRAILNCADNYPTKSGRVSLAGKDLVKILSNEFVTFDDAYSNFKTQKKVTKKLHNLICELNGSVQWFLQQHNMTISSIKISNPLSSDPTADELNDFLNKEKISLRAVGYTNKVLANRPKNWELRDFFKVKTELFQKLNGKAKFIKYNAFLEELGIQNRTSNYKKQLQVSVKGYYLLKKAWKNGSFNRIV